MAYDVKPRLWTSLDVNFGGGSRTTVNVVRNNDQQRNSRVGGTVSVPFTRRQSVKFSYSQGACVNIGGDYKTVEVAWQHSWIDSRY